MLNVQLFFTPSLPITQCICLGVVGFSGNVEAMFSDDLPAQLVLEEWDRVMRVEHRPKCLNPFAPQGDVLLYAVSDQHDAEQCIHWSNVLCTTVVQYRQ